MSRSLFLFLLVATLTQYSCNSEQGKTLRGYTGAPGEMLVLVDNYYWESAIGQAIQDSFLQPVPGLPQAEPIFDLQQLPHNQFRGIFENHRNVFRVIIKDLAEAGKAELEIVRNVWAKGQLVVTITADSEEGFLQLFGEKSEEIIELINTEERTRLLGRQRVVAEPEVELQIEETFGFNLKIPKGFKVATKKSGFLWLRRDQIRNVGQTSHDANQGLYIYTQNYSHEDQFIPEVLSVLRDSLTKKHIPGPDENSYMTTEYLIQPKSKVVAVNGEYGVEQRGLWRVEGAFMGGPFISVSTLDSSHTQLITIGGYVFAPKFDKREYLREIEAVLYTLSY